MGRARSLPLTGTFRCAARTLPKTLRTKLAMLDFEDKNEEEKRKNWYAPIGEYLILFSNFEFLANEWIDLISPDKAKADHIKGTWPFQKRINFIMDLINKYDTDAKTKEEWKGLWKKVIDSNSTRNLIAHNAPFENFNIQYNKASNRIEVEDRKEEIYGLKKPIGKPGSGLSLEKIKSDCGKLRIVIIALDKAYTGEIMGDL